MTTKQNNEMITSDAGRPLVARVASGGASVLRAIAGVPAGVSRTRRGTFLVVVIGTLALLAVIAIAHFAIGQSDRRTASSVIRATEIDDVPQQFADYVANIVGRDALGVVPEPVNEIMTPGSNEYQQRYIGMREATDRPFTSWMASSAEAVSTLANGQAPNRAYFTPEGVGSDPWLADIAPRWLNWAGANVARANEEYLYRRDWGKISNVAPDGRPVSLMNLRNNFGAESGFGNAANGQPRISANLSLLVARQANQPLSPLDIGNRTDFGLTVAVGSQPYMRAAVWDSRQVGAFRPMKVLQTGVLPSQVGYLDNEWADTDGDGFADARWFELVDARNLATVQSHLQTDGRLRWFFATRIIDLSGLVNVNTATDFRYEPNAAFPMGMTPADVDLKRLLALPDAYAHWGFGYDALMQPVENPNNYPAPAPGPIGSNNYLGYNRQTAMQVGLGAYDALRWSIQGHVVPERYESPAWNWVTAGATQDDERGVVRHKMWLAGGRSLQGASVVSGEVLLPSFFPVADTGELLTRFRVNDPRETSRLESATGARVGNAGGGGPAAVRTTGFDPLRQNREEQFELERTRRVQGNTTPMQLTETGGATREAMAQMAVDIRGQVTTLNASRPIKSVVGNDTTSGMTLPLGTQLIAERDGKLMLGKAAVSNDGLTGGETSQLFRAYVRSLAPAIKLPNVWPGAAGNVFDRRKTLFYGHQGPELALLVAGSMTTNFEALIRDTGGEVLISPRTLVFNGQFAERLFNNASGSPTNEQGLPAAPWLLRDQTMSLEIPNAGTQRVLADDTSQILTPVLHLYGMGAQPFMTEVGCFTVWRDTPAGNGGDDEAGGPTPLPQVTIEGALTADNDDLVFRCVAIQLHNPFSERVLVSTAFPSAGSAPNTASVYSYVRVTNSNQNDATPMSTIGLFSTDIVAAQVNGLTLDPGETIVVCAFDRQPEVVAARLGTLGVVANAGDGPVFLRSWAESQFRRNDVRRVVFGRTMTNDMSAWSAHTPIIDDPDGTRGLAFQLFQTQRANMDEYGAGDELANGAPNRAGNDRLLDRFRIPDGETIDYRIESANSQITGAPSGPDIPNEDPSRLNGNSGITVTRWATATRKADPAGAAIPRGGLPAYCIEPQRPQSLWHEYEVDRSGAANNDIAVTTSEIDAYVNASRREWTYDVSSWRTGALAAAYSDTISRAPYQKTMVANIANNRAGRPFAQIRDLLPKAARGDKGFGNVDNVFASRLPGDATSTPTLRPADLLLPMAISPWESPLQPDLQPQTDPRIRYLATSEAFAIAYGYEEIPPRSTAPNQANPVSLYAPTDGARNGDPLGSFGDASRRPVIENGHVVIDDFVPFYDGDADGVFTRTNAYNGYFQNAGTTAGRDIRFGLGIPAALGILDQVTTMGPVYGSVTQPIAGQININTAPPNVLRMLPLLTPADQSWNVGANRVVWQNANTDWPQMDPRVDLVASIAAYRDKVRTFELPGRTAPAIFHEDGTFGTPIGFVNQANSPTVQSTERQIGRAVRTQLNGIREETGFLSVGELQCVLNRDGDDRGQGTSRNRRQNVDALGFNNFNRSGALENDLPGFSSLLFRNRTGTDIEVDDVRNDFAERLQVLNAVANVVTVRSDMYACWFIVRGYAQSDVENLGPDDQMAPSVERRFLMILDRSNVVESRVTKPRIVLFKEVPM